TPVGGTGIGQPNDFFDLTQLGFYLTRCEEQQPATNCLPFGTYGNRERIDGVSGDWMQTFSGDANNSTLRLLLRYFSLKDLNGRSEVWLWKDRVTGSASNPIAASVSVAVYDEDENAHSIKFNLPHEVNFAPTADIITPGAPGGWFRTAFPCAQFDCTDYPFDN